MALISVKPRAYGARCVATANLGALSMSPQAQIDLLKTVAVPKKTDSFIHTYIFCFILYKIYYW